MQGEKWEKWWSDLCRLLPKSLFAWSKTFFDKSKARSSPAMQRDSPRFIRKKRFNPPPAERNFCLGNSLFDLDKSSLSHMRSKFLVHGFTTLSIFFCSHCKLFCHSLPEMGRRGKKLKAESSKHTAERLQRRPSS